MTQPFDLLFIRSDFAVGTGRAEEHNHGQSDQEREEDPRLRSCADAESADEAVGAARDLHGARFRDSDCAGRGRRVAAGEQDLKLPKRLGDQCL